MSRSRFFTTIAGLAASAALVAGCGGDKLTEFGIEQAIERQSGEDVDLDFSGDGFSVSTDEGDFSIDFDEDGNFSFDSEDGSATGNFDVDGGSITFDSDEGSGVISLDENGGVSFDGDQGSGAVNLGEVPDTWPEVVGLPATFIPDETVFSSYEWNTGVQQSGIFTHDPNEDFAGAVIDRLLAAGFTVSGDNQLEGWRSVVLADAVTQIVVDTNNAGQTIVNTVPLGG